MAFLLSRGTAVAWLRANRQGDKTKERLGVPHHALEASRTRLKHHVSCFEGLPRPLYLTTWNREDRRRTAVTVCNSMSLPRASIRATWWSVECFARRQSLSFSRWQMCLMRRGSSFLVLSSVGGMGLSVARVVFAIRFARLTSFPFSWTTAPACMGVRRPPAWFEACLVVQRLPWRQLSPFAWCRQGRLAALACLSPSSTILCP